MGMRNLKRNIAHFIPELVEIIGHATGAGAANLTALSGPGIASIAETGTGLYTITLEDKWNSLEAFSFGVMDPNSVDDWEVSVVAELVASSKTITIAVFKGGTLTDLTTDEKLFVRLLVSNSARPR